MLLFPGGRFFTRKTRVTNYELRITNYGVDGQLPVKLPFPRRGVIGVALNAIAARPAPGRSLWHFWQVAMPGRSTSLVSRLLCASWHWVQSSRRWLSCRKRASGNHWELARRPQTSVR